MTGQTSNPNGAKPLWVALVLLFIGWATSALWFGRSAFVWMFLLVGLLLAAGAALTLALAYRLLTRGVGGACYGFLLRAARRSF